MIIDYFYGCFLTHKIMHDATVCWPHFLRASPSVLVKGTVTLNVMGVTFLTMHSYISLTDSSVMDHLSPWPPKVPEGMISFYFQTGLKRSVTNTVPLVIMWVGGSWKEKKPGSVTCDCKVSHPEGRKNWQCAIWNDQVIRDDINTKSLDTANKPEWYHSAEHEPDWICQWVALILTASW